MKYYDSPLFCREALKVVKEFSKTGKSTLPLKRIEEISPDYHNAVLEYFMFRNWASQIDFGTITIDIKDIPKITLDLETKIKNTNWKRVAVIAAVATAVIGLIAFIFSLAGKFSNGEH